ncbi:hypothetical protein BDK51DRAFT_28128 [Blyttiomyces helicus]|uniref:Uncharacterized protein n=1 Tax=Blyttiomyces helicus TaxID=388810 RepID=A0A4P9WDH8_9FUNG|nr:hypothetical protein BDK51DRAFT_28128 [Blyttiomyces helicus]|eukprot:RKO89775.1 hypothetical protein BDK51DRAFT_28128 [Blyttiomyces helicus]
MSDVRAMVSTTTDFAAMALKTYRKTPAAANPLLNDAERACAACLRSPEVAALPGAREMLALFTGIFRTAREGTSPPQILHEIDAVLHAKPSPEPSMRSIKSDEDAYEDAVDEDAIEEDAVDADIIEEERCCRFLVSWRACASATEQVAANSPELKILQYGGCLAALQLATIGAGCHHLVSVDLSGGDFTDYDVQTLLHHCPSVAELNLISTQVTIITIHHLESHRPLTMLTLGGEDLRLLETLNAEISLCELLAARGTLLRRLYIGDWGWSMGAKLALVLPDAVRRARQSLRLVSMHSLLLPRPTHPPRAGSPQYQYRRW